MMTNLLIKPGYVYIMSNPAFPGWNKVGHTYRPPFRRANELSKTSVPTPFEVEYAKFFWDCPEAEKQIHFSLQKKYLDVQRKEFFNIPLEEIKNTLDTLILKEFKGKNPPQISSELGWEDTLEGKEDLWSWAEDDLRSSDPKLQREAWRTMERMSSMGWAEGSWRLAEHLVRHDMTQRGGNRAAWVLDAAYTQGMNEAKLRAAWLRSFESEELFQRFIKTFNEFQQKYGLGPEGWPHRASETFFAELSLWEGMPHRRLVGDWLELWK